MKKKLVSALALMMSCVMLAACGGNKVEENTTTPQTETSEAVTESTEEAASTETEAAGELTDVNVAALKGPTAMGMVKLMDDSDNGDTGANHYNFTIAASPDEITPQIVQGNVDIAAVPANLASVLYNKEGVDVSVLAVNTLGVLYIVENGDSVQSVADLKGKTIYASGKGATPEYALNYMLTANGIDPEKDVTIEYKSEHSECVAALAANEDAVAMLPQPFVTVAMTQNENIRVALDLTEEWEKASGDGDTKAALITGVVIARNDFIEAHPDAVETFLQQYEASVNYVNDNVADAAVLVGNYDIVAAQVAEKTLRLGDLQKSAVNMLNVIAKSAVFENMLDKLATSDDAVTAAEAKQAKAILTKNKAQKVLDDLGYESKEDADVKAQIAAAEKAKAEAEAAAKAAKAAADAAKAEAASANAKLEKNAFKAKKATVKKVTGKSKAAVVKVKKVKGADGYQVQYSKKANFKSAKKANTKKLNVTLKRLSKGSKYYVRVRAYKTINGQKVYTKYSAKKTVTVK